MLSTHFIKATLPSIKYFNWQKIGLLFRPINWQLMLCKNSDHGEVGFNSGKLIPFYDKICI